MDIIVSDAYRRAMLARLVSLFAILAIAVVTTISAAHAARMVGMQLDHTAHRNALMHASAAAHPSCGDARHGRSADAAICEFVCAGLSVILTIPALEARHAFGSADHETPAEAIHVSHIPGLNERPPKPRLL